eukprot:scaffold1938_cov125-Skeletonema_marinoi.AAC.1
MNQSTTATATNQVGYLAPLRYLSSFAPPHRRRSVASHFHQAFFIGDSSSSSESISNFAPPHHHRFEASRFHQTISIEVLTSSSSYFHYRSKSIDLCATRLAEDSREQEFGTCLPLQYLQRRGSRPSRPFLAKGSFFECGQDVDVAYNPDWQSEDF